jgi:hypothetical protein
MIRSSIGGCSLQLGGANAREEDATLDTLSTIITDYPEAITELFAGHRLAALIRRDAANTVETALGELGSGLLVEGSAGAGNWAAVPWISVFDPAINNKRNARILCGLSVSRQRTNRVPVIKSGHDRRP